MKRLAVIIAGVLWAGSAFAQVFPTNGHAASNFIPFGSFTAGRTPTMHQVFDSTLFSGATGGLPARISAIGFAPGLNGTFNLGQVDINLGYTNAIPGVGSAGGGLTMPTEGGGGNNVGAMTSFFSASFGFTATAFGSNNFQMVFNGTPFDYDPNQGNLLVEIIVPGAGNTTLHVSRATGSSQASRSYIGTRFTDGESPTTASRMDFRFTPVPEPATMTVLGLGALALLRRRRKKA